MVQSSVVRVGAPDGPSSMMGAWSFLRSTAYRAAVFWPTTENSKPRPIPILMSIDELTAVRRQHHHPVESSPLLEAFLVASGTGIVLQSVAPFAVLVGTILLTPHGGPPPCRLAAIPPGRPTCVPRC